LELFFLFKNFKKICNAANSVISGNAKLSQTVLKVGRKKQCYYRRITYQP